MTFFVARIITTVFGVGVSLVGFGVGFDVVVDVVVDFVVATFSVVFGTVKSKMKLYALK